MRLQMLTDGKPTHLIKTYAFLSQNRDMENALPKENVYVVSISSPTIQETSGVMEWKEKEKKNQTSCCQAREPIRVTGH